ncbi:MAG: hypothetical protein IK106_02960 [Clostridiales bacterium]|nr:hypothetical protein [Clostridiales bacterium]
MKKKLLVLFIVLFVFALLVPVRGKASDGGSISYRAVLYEVILVHKRELGPYGEPSRLTKGTIVKILGFEIVNDTETEYIDEFSRDESATSQ